jgi:hypothetical protein
LLEGLGPITFVYGKQGEKKITVDRLAERKRARSLSGAPAGFGGVGGINSFGDRAMSVCGLPTRFGESERGILAETETAAPNAVVDPYDPSSGERAVRGGVDAQEEARGAVCSPG